MAADWNLGALVVALIALAFTPGPQRLIERLVTRLYTWIWPASARCRALEWHDIQDEQPFHLCRTGPAGCAHHLDPAFAEFFTAKKASRAVKKPPGLDLNTTYIRTDTVTLKAFLVLLHRQDMGVQFERCNNVMTASIRPRSLGYYPPKETYDISPVTKREIIKIIDGYPPWYRDPLPLSNGASIPHPIQDIADVSRGGWIVGVGLSRVKQLNIDLLTTAMTDRQNLDKDMITRALKRVFHCLQNLYIQLKDHRLYFAQGLVQRGIDLVQREAVPSGYEWMWWQTTLMEDFGWDPEENPERRYAKKLTKSQSILAIQIFSQYQEPSEEQIKDLEGIWMIAMRAALVGSFVVVFEAFWRHRKSECGPSIGRNRYQMPKELDDHRHIYLYETNEDEDRI